MAEEDDRPIYQPVGCTKCDNQGYKGRMAIMEIFKLDAEIDEINDRVYRTVNNGVYRAGFATAQDKYDEAVTALEPFMRVPTPGSDQL